MVDGIGRLIQGRVPVGLAHDITRVVTLLGAVALRQQFAAAG